MGSKIFVSAGEASGDTHLAAAIAQLQQQGKHCQWLGMGGPALAHSGVEILADCREVSVVGIVEPLWRYWRIRRVLETLKQALIVHQPDLLILADFPDFNLRLAQAAKQLGIPVLFYISPQVWAWRRGRIWQIAERVDCLGTLFPFEAEIYAETGLDVRYLGHPLLDEIDLNLTREAAREQLQIEPDQQVIAVLPGSRPGEFQRLAQIFVDAANLISKRSTNSLILAPLANTLDPNCQHRIDSELPIRWLSGQAHSVLKAADLAIVASGTATLEAAILGAPSVVGYKLHPLSYMVMRRMSLIPDIALVNIVAGQRICPELVQKDCTVEALAAEGLALLQNPDKRQRMQQQLAQVREALGEAGHMQRLADLIAEMLPAL